MGKRVSRVCELDGCVRPHAAKGFCAPHYMHKVVGPRRRLRIEAARLSFSADQLKAKMAYWGDKCWVCGGQAQAIDHVKPVSRGGPHMLANFRPICKSCNSRKSNQWPLQPEYRHCLPSGHVGGAGSSIRDATLRYFSRISESEEDREKRWAIEDAEWKAEWERTGHLRCGFASREEMDTKMAEFSRKQAEKAERDLHFREVVKGEFVSVDQLEMFDA